MTSPRSLAVALLLGSLAVRMPNASAASFTVDSPLDEVDAAPGDGACQTVGGTCTLRAAVQEANALAGADTIDVPAGTYVLTIPQTSAQDASTGQLNITEALTVSGAGAADTILDGNGATRLFDATAPLTVSGVTIRNCADYGSGGGIDVRSAPLVMSDCLVTGNSVNIVGGGIYAEDLTLARTTVSGNIAGLGGGGIAAIGGSVRDSTVTGNTNETGAPLGGDAVLLSGGGTFMIANSTIDGTLTNISFCTSPPTPLFCSNGDTLTVANVTVETLEHRNFGGIPGTTTVRNSIVRQCAGIVVSQGYNLFHLGGCSIVGDTTGNIAGLDPRLGPLADNGGPTETRKPWSDSPVIDAGNPAAPGSGGIACEGTDQRGVVRPLGPRCDMGAVEGDCGDGIPGPGEECDDGNTTNGDGCDNNCRVTGCGNGIVTAGEACDDGNLVAGDCCSPTCQAEPAGSPCAADSNVCTDDVCNGSGACTHPDNVAACDDGNPCTSDDHCANGVCGGTFCDPCLECSPSAGCVVPTMACAPAASEGSKLTLAHGAVDRVSWRWKSAGPVAKNDFGNPVFTYPERFCVYDGGNQVVLSASAAGSDCGIENCWRERDDGFRYRNKTRLPDGLQSMDLVAGDPGQIRVRGKGPGLDDLGVLPLATPVHVRVFVGDFSACWGAEFDAGVTKNTSSMLKGRSD